MKKAHLFISKEALSELLFGSSIKIVIDDIASVSDGSIFLTIEGDDLPEDCLETSTRQVRMHQIKDVHVDSEGKVHSKFIMEILMRDQKCTNFGKTTYAKS